MARPGHPAAPPECPPGWTTGTPEFVGIGADRSGTTWWHALVCSHPRVSVVPGAEKELHFFDPFWDGSFGDEDAERYRQYFPRAEGSIAGEWTPRYMYDVWTPALLARAAPHAKLLVSLRDPLARYRSHLRTRIAVLPQDAFLGAEAAIALSRSLYAYPLLRVLCHFPRERLLVLQHERCVADTAGELRRTFEFLGLDDVDWVPEEAERPLNTGPAQIEVPAGLEQDVAATFAEDLRRLRDIAPEIEPGLWQGSESN
jgi:Sulfotransferase family